MAFPNFSYDEQVLAGIAKSLKIHEMYVFGSVLREDFSEKSDVDLLVVFDENSHYSLFDLMEVKEKLESFFGRDVDLVEKDSLRNPYRRKAILGSARKIYAS